jgi:hypothetical protein
MKNERAVAIGELLKMICRDVCNGMEPLMRGQGQFLLTHGLFQKDVFTFAFSPGD